MKRLDTSSRVEGILDLLTTKDVITSLDEFTSFCDEPPFHAYTCSFRQDINSDNNENSIENSYGISIKSSKLALIKCLCECIEQLCLFAKYDDSKIIHSSHKRLSKPSFSPSLFDDEDVLEDKRFGWIAGVNFDNNKVFYVPAQLIYFKYKRSFDEAKINQPRLISGTAADFSEEGALLHSIYEIVERDSFMTSYLNMIECPELDLKEVKDLRIKSVLKKCDRYNLQLRTFITTSDLGIPSFLTLLIETTQTGPALSCGIKAGFHEVDALLGSIEEVLLVRGLKRKELSVFPTLPRIEVDQIKTLSDNFIFWSHTESLNFLNFLLKQKPKRIDIANFEGGKKLELQKVKDILKKNNKETYYVDITLPEFKKIGIYVFKVIIPQLQPLYREIKNGVLRKKRLEEVALFHGIKQNQINKIPHPFF